MTTVGELVTELLRFAPETPVAVETNAGLEYFRREARLETILYSIMEPPEVPTVILRTKS